MVTYNRIPLTSISDHIGILDVVVKAAKIKTDTYAPPKVDGLRRLSKSREEKKVTITFDIFTDDPIERQQILDDIGAWADTYDDKWLEIDDYDGKHLIASCTDLPDMASVANISKSMKVEFSAFDPYWYENTPTRKTITTAAGVQYDTTMIVKGSSRSCFLSYSVTNNGASPMTNVIVTAGDTAIELDGISLASGETLEVGYSDTGLLYMLIGETSVLGTRTDESDDDLILTQRASNSISITTDQDATVVLSARGASL